MSKELRVVLAGGVSGGHIYPLIAVSEAMRRAATEADVALALLLSTTDGVALNAGQTALVRVMTTSKRRVQVALAAAAIVLDAT